MADLRIGVLVTHPVQYHAPLYRVVADTQGVDLTVYYAHRPTPTQQGEDFGVPFEWDIDLTSGYRAVFLQNRAASRGTGFRGFDTPEISPIIERERFDAFVVSGWHALAYWQAIRACWAAGTPVMVRGDSQLYDDGPAKRLLKRTVYRRILPRFDACLSVGTRSEEYFSYYGARRVYRVPHFVDNARFERIDRAASAREPLRAAWGIRPDAFVALLPAKLIERKRPLDLIRALAMLGGDVHGLIAGEGVLRQACAEEAARLGVALTITGFLNQQRIGTAYAAADVMVLPSSQDTWGLVANEAMASGVPIVVSEACGCAPDLVVPGKTGFAFPVGDIGALAAALRCVRDAERTGAGLGAEAHRHVSTFSAERAAAALIDAASKVARRTWSGRTAAIVALLPVLVLTAPRAFMGGI